MIVSRKNICYFPITRNLKNTQGGAMSIVDIFLIFGTLILLIFIFERYEERMYALFTKIVSPRTPDVIDIEKICKQIRKTPER